MKRVARRLLTVSAAVSLLLCVLVLMRWSAVPARNAAFVAAPPGGVRALTPAELALRGNEFGRHELRLAGACLVRTTYFLHRDPPPGQTHGVRNGNGLEQIEIKMPYWLAAMVTSLLPALWLALFRRDYVRWNRSAAGCCRFCGYDLRESPERCPECGRARVDPL